MSIYVYTSIEDACLLQTYCVFYIRKNIQPHLLTYLRAGLHLRHLCVFPFREGQLFSQWNKGQGEN